MRYIKSIALFISVVAVGIIMAAAYSSYNQNKDCGSINDQSTREDCYHALAHATNDKNICNKIAGNEKQEHCLGHIPD